jgi:predicted nucleic acid-binding OB-fold protein
MPNYLAIHKKSQLILKVITTSHTPTPDEHHEFHPVSTTVLNRYYKLATKSLRNGVQVTVGELMAACPSFMEQISKGEQGKVKLVTTRIRKELTPVPDDRLFSIQRWVINNPDGNNHDLSDAFNTGAVAAKAYLDKYR